jgi:hypothetical protein
VPVEIESTTRSRSPSGQEHCAVCEPDASGMARGYRDWRLSSENTNGV